MSATAKAPGLLQSLLGGGASRRTKAAPNVERRSKEDARPGKREGKGRAPEPEPERKAWKRPPRPPRQDSITDEFAFVEYDPEWENFLMSDGVSVAAIYELSQINTEGQSKEFKADLAVRLQNLVAKAVPQDDREPWVVQWFVQDEYRDFEIEERLRTYRSKHAASSAFSAYYGDVLANHVKAVAREGGYFYDETVTDAPFQNRVRRLRCVIYKRLLNKRQATNAYGETPDEALANVCSSFEKLLKQSRIRFERVGGKGFYEWMVPFLNPKPASAGGDPYELLKRHPYPGDDDVPWGRDFAEMMMFSCAEADAKEGVIYLDGMPHTAKSWQGLMGAPDPGILTGEQKSLEGNGATVLFDDLPPGTMLVMTTVYQSQDAAKDHIKKIESDSLGGEIEADLAKEDAHDVRIKMERGDSLFPVEVCAYLRADTLPALRQAELDLETKLSSVAKIGMVSRYHELIGPDRWFENLPMAYDPSRMKRHLRAKLTFASHQARLLPAYGRTRGTGNPGLLFFNRGGETLTVDPIKDRAKAAHALFFGPTGAGKSATLNHTMLSMEAAHHPTWFIIDYGGSFKLMVDLLEKHGLSVHKVDFRPGTGSVLPPFADAMRVLDDYDSLMEAERKLTDVEENQADAEGPADLVELETTEELAKLDDDEERDFLGEQTLLAQLMITGGEKRAMTDFSRADQAVLERAIIAAARTAREEGAPVTLPRHVAAELEKLVDAQRNEKRQDKVEDMAAAMQTYCNPASLGGKLFGASGEAWPDVDVTYIELGALGGEGKEAELAIAYTALMNRITSMAERNVGTGRPIITVTDEGHLITKNPLLVNYVVKLVKTWRKIGAWYWLATQQFTDFPDEAAKILSLCEFWLCLTMEADDLAELKRFRTLTPEEELLITSTEKAKGQYTEGVILSKALRSLVRIVLPKITLALAGTDQEEKEERAELMAEHGFQTELEAAEFIARRMEAQA